jgi:hypothetical protein
MITKFEKIAGMKTIEVRMHHRKVVRFPVIEREPVRLTIHIPADFQLLTET